LIRCNIQDLRRTDNTIYEFPLCSGIGEKIIERLDKLSYYSVTTDIGDSLMKIVNQNDRMIDFGSRQICITLHFRPKRWKNV
jgi:hypothetical protein